MSVSFDKIRHDAYELSLEEKTELIDFLLLSIHNTPSPEVESAWAAELAARSRALAEGRSKTIPWTEVKAKFDKYFETRRDIR